MLVYRTDPCPSHLPSLTLLCVPLNASATIYVYIQRNAHLRRCVNVSKQSRLCIRASRESSALAIARSKFQYDTLSRQMPDLVHSVGYQYGVVRINPKLRADKGMMHWPLQCPPYDNECFQRTKHQICKGCSFGQHSLQAIPNLQAAGSFYM